MPQTSGNGSQPLSSIDVILAAMSPQDRERAQTLLRNIVGVQPFEQFIAEHFPHQHMPPHAAIIRDILQRARTKRLKVALSMPPRHTKTTMLLRGVAWWLKHSPADTCGYYSYSDTQGRSKSRLAREWSQLCGVELSPESQDMSEWRTIQGGGMLAGGAGGALTGHGISGIMIVDDPFKNRSEADSALIRDRIWEWFNEVVMTRLEGGSVIVVHTRWHPDDLISRLAKDDTWEVINLAAIAEENDPLGRPIGQALWPERFPVEELDAIRKQIGDWSFAALYAGRPQPRGSNVFHEPARCDLPGFDDRVAWRGFLEGKTLVIGVDPAASERTHADYSVAIVLAVDSLQPDKRGWILDVVRGQWTVPALVERLRELQRTWSAPLIVEAVGGFKAVPQMLKHIDPSLRIVEVRPTVDKFQRAQGVAAAWNEGRVMVPINRHWTDALLSEIVSFTGVKDAHDDQVDALAHCWNALAQSRPQRTTHHRPAHGPFG
jgi:predicted phage terminase large subunit-like protein